MMKKAEKVLKIIVPIFLVLSAASGAVMFLTSFGVKAIYEATGGYGPYDMRLSYTPDAFMSVLSHIEGDKDALYSRYFMIDYCFCICTSVFMAALPLMIYLRDDKHYLLFRAAVFSSIMYLVFNVTENILIMRIVRSIPLFTDGDANLSSGITTLKWAFCGVWGLSVILLLIVTFIDILKKRKTSS